MSTECQVCGRSELVVVPHFDRLQRVTSDCRPFAAGGFLLQCPNCGTIQKRNDEKWRAECEAIYANYDIYGLSSGVEQSVRSGDGTEFAPRSELALRTLQTRLGLPERGRLLDFGCGKGSTARAASNVLTGWAIDGFDQDDRAGAILSAIPRFDRLFTGDLDQVPQTYDLIVLMHALEHIANPVALLRSLATKLRPGGRILVEVPDCAANPYDLLVADHLIHFDLEPLKAMGTRTGLTVLEASRDWIAKELTLVLSVSDVPSRSEARTASAVTAATQVEWLGQVSKELREASSRRPLCIFGTSIVATWLASELPAPPDMYLDEDPAKIGRSLDGVPILAPKDAPANATVALALAPALANVVAQRLTSLGLKFVKLPPYPGS